MLWWEDLGSWQSCKCYFSTNQFEGGWGISSAGQSPSSLILQIPIQLSDKPQHVWFMEAPSSNHRDPKDLLLVSHNQCSCSCTNKLDLLWQTEGDLHNIRQLVLIFLSAQFGTSTTENNCYIFNFIVHNAWTQFHSWEQMFKSAQTMPTAFLLRTSDRERSSCFNGVLCFKFNI